MNNQTLKSRTKQFAVDIYKFVISIPDSPTTWHLTRQILRSSSSVAANYRAVCRAKSDRDFISKMETVIEEADETQFWLELIQELEVSNSDQIGVLMTEANELVSIFVASVKTIKKRLNQNKS